MTQTFDDIFQVNPSSLRPYTPHEFSNKVQHYIDISNDNEPPCEVFNLINHPEIKIEDDE